MKMTEVRRFTSALGVAFAIVIGPAVSTSLASGGWCGGVMCLPVPTKALPTAGFGSPIVIINGRDVNAWPRPRINVIGKENWMTVTSNSYTDATALADIYYTGHELYDITSKHYGSTTVLVRFKCRKLVAGSPQAPGGPGGDHITILLSTPSSNNGPYPVGDTNLDPPDGPS